MPVSTPLLKIIGTEKLGAEIVLYGDSVADAATRAEEIAAEPAPLSFIPMTTIRSSRARAPRRSKSRWTVPT